MILETYKRHIPALLIVLVSVGSWVVLLSILPDPIRARLTFSGDYFLSMDPASTFVGMCGFMAGFHLIMVLMDLFVIAPLVPGYIVAAIDWIVEGIGAIFYLPLLGAAAGVLPNVVVGLVVGAAGMIVVLAILYRRAAASVEEEARHLSDAPYVERVGPSLMTRVFFFARPVVPSMIVVASGGIRLIGILYDVTYPWGQIERVSEATYLTFLGNRPIRLNHTLKNCVEIHLKDRKRFVVVSPRERGRFMETAARFLTRG